MAHGTYNNPRAGSNSSKDRMKKLTNKVNGPRKTVEPVKTDYIGGGHFEESDGFAGVGTKKTIRDKKGRIKKEVIKSTISPENREHTSKAYSEYGSKKGFTKQSKSKKVTKYNKDYRESRFGSAGIISEKTIDKQPGLGLKKTVTKSTFDKSKDWGESGYHKFEQKATKTRKLKKALRQEKKALDKPGVQYGDLTKTYR